MVISRNVLHQMVAILPLNLMWLDIGINSGWAAPVIKALRKPNKEMVLTTEECSWIASLLYGGRTIGPFVTGYLLDKVGCNKILMLSAVILFVPWIMVTFTRSFLVLCIARFMLGFARGIIDMVCVVYISENSSIHLRSVFSNSLMVFLNIGLLMAFTLPTFLDYTHVAEVNVVFAFLTLLSVVLLREPAPFLIAHGKDAEAKENFFWLRGCNVNTKKEFDTMHMYALEEHSKSTLNLRELLKDKTNRKTSRVVFIVTTLTIGTGFSALTSVITEAFSSVGDSFSSQLTIMYGLFQLLVSFMSSFFVERFGRRTLMMTAAIASFVLHTTSGVLYYVEENVTNIPHFIWLVFTTTTLYSALYVAILLPLSSTIRGELLSQSIKSACGSAATVLSSGVCFLQSHVFLLISESYGIENNFFIFATVAILLALYVYFELPETRGKSLANIQKALSQDQFEITEKNFRL